MIVSRETAKFIGKFLVIWLVILFNIDLMLLFINYEDIRLETYMSGVYTSGISADTLALVNGETEHSKLYKTEDLLDAFEEYSNSVYLSKTKLEPIKKRTKDKIQMTYLVDEMRIKSISTACTPVTHRGDKGVVVGVRYIMEPATSMIVGPLRNFPIFDINMTRRFRITGS